MAKIVRLRVAVLFGIRIYDFFINSYFDWYRSYDIDNMLVIPF